MVEEQIGGLCKNVMENNLVEGATWEDEADMKSHYPYLFTNQGYLFLLIIKIITKIEVAMIFSDVCKNMHFYVITVKLQ